MATPARQGGAVAREGAGSGTSVELQLCFSQRLPSPRELTTGGAADSIDAAVWERVELSAEIAGNAICSGFR